MVLIKDGDQEKILDGITIEMIVNALTFHQKEKARQANKYQRYYKKIRDEKREEILQSLPPPPVEDKPKRCRGRPRKYPVGTPRF